MTLEELIKIRLEKEVDDEIIVCENCGWYWGKSDGGEDLYICHKCGYDNEKKLD